MASSKISNGNLAPIRKELDAITHMGYNPSKVFADWIGLMFYAYLRDDQAYLKIMKDYRNEEPQGKREADHFANAHGYLFAHMKETNEEVLSGLYMEYCANTNIGQFFTPYDLAECMCNLTCKDYPQDRQFTISDPTCGAGVFFIAAAKNMSLDENRRAIFIGHDLDINCVRMCALNLMFFNLNGIIIHGNTLTMEVKDSWQTTRTLLGGNLQHVDPESVKKWYCATFLPENTNRTDNKKTTKKVIKIPEQCGLFD